MRSREIKIIEFLRIFVLLLLLEMDDFKFDLVNIEFENFVGFVHLMPCKIYL